MSRFDEWMQECWNKELDQDLQEQAELAADIRREQEEADEDLRRELEMMDRDFRMMVPWNTMA